MSWSERAREPSGGRRPAGKAHEISQAGHARGKTVLEIA
jgi:hypothetical protein